MIFAGNYSVSKYKAVCTALVRMGGSWYWLTQVALDKGPLNGCVCVSVLYSTEIKIIITEHKAKY